MDPMFGDLFKLLGQQGPDAWFQTATQLALNVARGDDGDPNPQPRERQRLEEFAPLVGRHVDALFGVPSRAEVTAVNRSGLTLAALRQWKPLLAPLTESPPSLNLDNVEGGAMMAQLAGSFGPLFLGFQTGSVAGHFSERAWSLAALTLPRESDERLLVVNNLAAFAQEWSNMSSFMSNPESLLDGIELPGETDATRAINAAAAGLGAVFDAAAEQVTTALLGPRPTLSEAWRRHRLSDARGEDAAAALFAISNQGPHHEAARAFVAELVAEHSINVFAALLRVDGLPSDAELRDPAAWYERVTNSPLA